MQLISTQPRTKGFKHEVFQRFCGSLRNPVFTDNNHIIASVNVIWYRDGKLGRFWGEILLITHGCEFGSLSFSEGDIELFNDAVYSLLENGECSYLTGRSNDVLVIEMPSSTKSAVNRLELTEDIKLLAG